MALILFRIVPFRKFPGRLINVITITSSGTCTLSAGAKGIIVKVQGAGGGVDGGGATSASTFAIGSGGAYAKSYITSLAASYAVTIGGHDAGGVNGPGGNANSTTFGSIIT